MYLLKYVDKIKKGIIVEQKHLSRDISQINFMKKHKYYAHTGYMKPNLREIKVITININMLL